VVCCVGQAEVRVGFFEGFDNKETVDLIIKSDQGLITGDELAY
jgi:hypothetical protein